jgi:hypothetical protein
MEKEGDGLPPLRSTNYLVNLDLFNLVFAKMVVKMNGTTMAINIHTANMPIYFG